MILKDLRILEIALELYKREEKVESEQLHMIDFLLNVLRHDIEHKGQGSKKKKGGDEKKKQSEMDFVNQKN